MRNNTLWKVLLVVAAIGALNWGLVGLFNWNLVDAIFGGGAREITSAFSRVIYTLIGLAGLGALLLMPTRRETLVERHEPPPVGGTWRDHEVRP